MMEPKTGCGATAGVRGATAGVRARHAHCEKVCAASLDGKMHTASAHGSFVSRACVAWRPQPAGITLCSVPARWRPRVQCSVTCTLYTPRRRACLCAPQLCAPGHMQRVWPKVVLASVPAPVANTVPGRAVRRSLPCRARARGQTTPVTRAWTSGHGAASGA